MSVNNQIEVVEAYYNTLENPSYKLRRVNTSQGRFYLVDKRLFISVTSLIDMTTKQDEGLIRKMCDVGYNEWMKFLNERASYGTIMHILIADFLRDKKIDFDTLATRAEELLQEQRVERSKWARFTEDLTYDMLSFAEFAHDTELQPIAVELPLVSFQHGFAGTLDLVCVINQKEKGFFGEVYKTGPQKGSPKETYKTNRVIAIIDFKSGRNGFTEKHADQLALCQLLINENYPNLVENYDATKMAVFNWAPKAWLKYPSYSLKDQTGATSDMVMFSKIAIAQTKIKDVMPSYLSPMGTLSLGDSPAESYIFKDIVS